VALLSFDSVLFESFGSCGCYLVNKISIHLKPNLFDNMHLFIYHPQKKNGRNLSGEVFSKEMKINLTKIYPIMLQTISLGCPKNLSYINII
jgi:hypothetical protein